MSETFTVIISGIESEKLALDLTKALLQLQHQRQASKAAWRSLEFRPFALSPEQAKALLQEAKPVILHDNRLSTIGPSHQLADHRPTLRRVDHQRPRRA